MLIVSKFHDYYDVGMNNGIDKTVVYVRDTVDLVEKFLRPSRRPAPDWYPAVLAFCGKFYPFVYFENKQGQIEEVIWDVEEAVARLPKSRYSFSPRWDRYSLSYELGIRAFFDKKYPNLEKIFHELKTPIFGFYPVLRTYSWQNNKEEYSALTLNPCLKNIEFYKVKDPITAFQEVYMFISGVIGIIQNPMIEISDKDKAEAKGHGGKYSFRKPPGKRGKKRWR